MWSSQSFEGIELESFEPAAARDDAAVLLFHGRHEMRWCHETDWTRHLTDLKLRAIAPHLGEGWWFDRPPLHSPDQPSPLQRLLNIVIPQFQQCWDISPPRIALVGFDSGGAAAMGLAYRHARQFPIVAAIEPAIDFHLLVGRGTEVDLYFETREAARQQTAPLHLHPLDWPKKQWIATHPRDERHEGSERLLSKLDSIGIPCERVVNESAKSPAEFLKQQIRPALEFVLQAMPSLS